jgi:hypothetical protein
MEDYRTIIHLEIEGRHEYFGSPSSLYDKYTSDELGISKASLNNFFSKLSDDAEQIYTNKFCTIRKGLLYVKPSTRGRKKQVSLEMII